MSIPETLPDVMDTSFARRSKFSPIPCAAGFRPVKLRWRVTRECLHEQRKSPG